MMTDKDVLDKQAERIEDLEFRVKWLEGVIRRMLVGHPEYE